MTSYDLSLQAGMPHHHGRVLPPSPLLSSFAMISFHQAAFIFEQCHLSDTGERWLACMFHGFLSEIKSWTCRWSLLALEDLFRFLFLLQLPGELSVLTHSWFTSRDQYLQTLLHCPPQCSFTFCVTRCWTEHCRLTVLSVLYVLLSIHFKDFSHPQSPDLTVVALYLIHKC